MKSSCSGQDVSGFTTIPMVALPKSVVLLFLVDLLVRAWVALGAWVAWVLY